MKEPVSHLNFSDSTCARLRSLGFDPETFSEEAASHNEGYLDEAPSVYCGTYAKYNAGSLAGMWIDLTTFADYDEFHSFCCALHADEDDPELMFQDYENFPRSWYDESCLDRKTFEKIQTFVELSDQYKPEALMAWVENYNDIDDFKNYYIGEWDSEEDFAEHIIDECYSESLPDFARNYFDYKAFARDLFSDGYEFYDGYVFYNR